MASYKDKFNSYALLCYVKNDATSKNDLNLTQIYK